jgi:hypothetical protein
MCKFAGCARISDHIDGDACVAHQCRKLNCKNIRVVQEEMCKLHLDCNPFLEQMEQLSSMIETMLGELEEAKRKHDEWERKRRKQVVRARRKKASK